MNKHDKKEIEKLKKFKEWILRFRKLTREEQEQHIIKRWRESD